MYFIPVIFFASSTLERTCIGNPPS